ncbi:hypothetical protein EJB05_35896 [Eragrostis curvula]|uniref:DUF4005 domain-containing protein n=1 Tax=Eragrostis curvula TaxID=38414 RepID=A0A5J9U8R3_9POAL|nr:hypothetical protein EJB05_35896 [Eragrostis curvula]
MGKKVRWFDAVQKILSPSEPDPVETEAKKPAKSKDKSSFKKLWQFTKSSNASTSAAASVHQQQPPPPSSPSKPDQQQQPPPPLSPSQPHHHQQQQPPPPSSPSQHDHQQQPPPPSSPSQPDQQQGQEIVVDEQSAETRCEQGDRACPAEEAAGTHQEEAAEPVAAPTDATPRAQPPRSEDIAAIRLQAACRGYLARRAHRERGMARLMSLVEGPAVKRQTEEALYCMQAMTRIQTQIYSRRLKTEEDKKALKSQIKIKQSLDKAKVGEGWDLSHQSKEQMEAVMTMKHEAASRRQRALAYAFSHQVVTTGHTIIIRSHFISFDAFVLPLNSASASILAQWSNRNPRNPSSARAAPAPMFMDPGNPNWGWTWTERWMAAARPWESQTTAPSNGRATAKSAGVRPRVAAISVQPPTTPGSRSFRRPNWPSLQSPLTPPPRSPSVSARTTVPVPASPRSSTLHAPGGLLQRAKSLQPDRRPHDRAAAAASSPRCVVPATANPRGGGGGSPLRTSGGGGLQRATSMQPERCRPRSSQERAASSPRLATGTNAALLRTTSLRSEPLRKLNLQGGAAPASAAENETVPVTVTPSYMQPTTSVRAKARCASPSSSSSPNKADAPERTPAPPRTSSPSSAKKRQSLRPVDKSSASSSSPSTAKAERAKRHSQPPSPRRQLT